MLQLVIHASLQEALDSSTTAPSKGPQFQPILNFVDTGHPMFLIVNSPIFLNTTGLRRDCRS